MKRKCPILVPIEPIQLCHIIRLAIERHEECTLKGCHTDVLLQEMLTWFRREYPEELQQYVNECD